MKAVVESMSWATCLFFLRIASEGYHFQLLTIVDSFSVAFFYWLLLSTNLFTQTMLELKIVASGNRLSNSLVNIDPRQAFSGLRYLFNNFATISLNVFFKYLASLFLVSLIQNCDADDGKITTLFLCSAQKHTGLGLLAMTFFLDSFTKSRKRISMLDSFNIFAVFVLAGFIRSSFPVIIYTAIIGPSLSIGSKLKFPTGEETFPEPIDLCYNDLSDMIQMKHNDDSIYYLGLIELRNILRRDTNK